MLIYRLKKCFYLFYLYSSEKYGFINLSICVCDSYLNFLDSKFFNSLDSNHKDSDLNRIESY